MKRIQIEIEGLQPGLLMHRYPMVKVENEQLLTPEEQAEISAYRKPDSKELYLPGNAVKQALVAAASYSKGRGKGTLSKIAAATFFVEPEYIGLGVQDYVIFSASVIIKATKGRIVRHRPHLPEWKAKFALLYDETKTSKEQIKKIVEDCGQLVGVLDFRPACKGPFGRFMVTKFEEQK